MAEVTERDIAVWSAYVGTALTLDPAVHDLGDKVRKGLSEAKDSIDSGKVNAGLVVKACEAGVKACDLEEGTHPSIGSKVAVVRVNLGAVIEAISGTKPKSGRVDSEAVDDTTDEAPVDDDGKVDCSCGKRHAAGSKVLERHTKSKG